MTLRNIIIALALLGAIVTSWLVLERRGVREEPRAPVLDSGYYLREAVVEGIGTDGTTLYTLRAERIQQAPSDNSVSLQVVDLEYSSPDGEPWSLRADEGAIPADGERISLFGNVKIEEMLFVGPETTVVTTPDLDVDLRAHLATTDSEVRIERGNYLITAVGIRADLKDRKLRLQSEVHGRFLP
ncbi:MAG: LPS export ABC transporter periplasmic protein LptC [Gammaproteobacteria bacterium]|nr:LPS export ABC transporter periplasmic protein LptC [Gammaproteobacteria bacterium]